jgi:type II secretory pathway component HofQ
MKMLAAAIWVAPLLLLGALPAGAQTAKPAAADKDSYTHQAQEQVQQWKQKLGTAGDKASATGKDASDATQKHLKQAWSKTQEASRKLQTAGDSGWESAKRAYEKASRDLANTWHKIHPDDK